MKTHILKSSKLLEFGILCSLTILVFLYDVFSNVFGFFDEFLGLLSVFVICYFFVFKGRIQFFRQEYYIFLLFSAIVSIGLLSNLFTKISGHVTNPKAIIADLITFSKGFITYFAIRLIAPYINSKRVLEKLKNWVKIIFYFLVIIILFDITFDIFPKSYRFGFNSLELFFQHGSRYAFAFSFIFLVLLAEFKSKHLELILVVLLIGLFSLRVKYMGFLGLALLLLFAGKELLKVPKKYFLIILSGVSAVLIWVFWDRILMYFEFKGLNEAWSRAVVTYYSFIIGFDYFPIGTGFGTFSSYYSGYYYSWVYDAYGISAVYGINRAYWYFVADQYWPMVLGQFGYFGLVFMILIVYYYLDLFLTYIKAFVKDNRYYLFLSALLGMFLLLIDSTSDSVFSQQRGVAIFIFFGLIVNSVSRRK